MGTNTTAKELAEATGARIRWRRRQLKLSCEDAASMSKWTSGYLYSVERGKSMPSLLKLRRLARVLKCTVDDLTSGPVPKLPPERNTRAAIAAKAAVGK